MNTDTPLLIERDGAMVRLVLNRPHVGNALDIPLAQALMDAAISCDEDDTIRCVVLTGSGRLFCAGGDINGFSEAGDELPSLLKEITDSLHKAVARFARMAKPLIVAVNGPAAGAGLSLAMLGDIVLAARSAHFSTAYGAIGLSPDGGATWLLPRLIGLRRAQEMAITNRRVKAEEAAEIGLVTRVVDDATLADDAAALATTLASSATQAIGRTRALLLDSFGASLETQMDHEARSIADLSRSPHGIEGVTAFLAKRKPTFD